MKQTIDQILQFTNLTKRSIILNNEYKFKCEFKKLSNNLDDSCNIFSEKIKENSCPRYIQYANVDVKDLTTGIKYIGCLDICYDLDTSLKHVSLAIKTENDKNWTRIITIVSMEIK